MGRRLHAIRLQFPFLSEKGALKTYNVFLGLMIQRLEGEALYASASFQELDWKTDNERG